MLGSFLKKYRLANGLTQADLAIKLSVSQNSISQYESGKRNPSVKRLADIAKVLNCSMNDIGVRIGHMNRKEKIMERIAVSVAEAAEMLGMCPKTVYQLTRRADFPAFKAGNRTVISVEGLQEWVRRQAMGEGAAV